jgi:phosphinothricin acetyltransferase
MVGDVLSTAFDIAAMMPQMDDTAFLSAFEDCTIPKEEWTHAAHVRMAWLYLEAHGLEGAMPLVRGGIQRYNRSLGNTTGYHDTITRFFVQLTAHRRLCTPEPTWAAFAARHPDLVERSGTLLGRHYSRAALASPAAIDGWAEPDLRPLPALGAVRPATAADAPALAAIYAPYVLDTVLTFDEAAPSADEMARRLGDAVDWLVFERAGEVVGYAGAVPHKARPGDRWSVDTNVYVRPDVHARGVARALYTRLFDRLAGLGYHNAFAGVVLPNEPSVALHEALGFTRVGVYRNVGYKHGRWHDTAWFQRALRSPAPDPQPPRRA